MLPRLLLALIAAIFLLSAGVKAYHGVPTYKVGGDLYAAFVHNEAWKHYTFLAVEGTLGLWLLTGWKRNWSAQAALFLLATLTSLLLAEFFFSSAPKVCGCFGSQLTEHREEAKTALLWSTTRNVGLIAALAWALWKMNSPRVTESHTSPSDPVPV